MKIIKEFKGWIGKTDLAKDVFEWNAYGQLRSKIFATKGRRIEWADEDWPSREVRVLIVEDEE